MKKRLLALLLTLSISSTMIVGVAQASTPADSYVAETILALGIMEGDESGNIEWESTVTRAQFTKMLMTASPEKDKVTSSGTGYSLYSDVKSDHWASAYIKLAVEAGYMTGYTDGTYRPNDSITLEQACTAILKMLGYSTSSLTGSYPDAQINFAWELGLLDDVGASKGQALNRNQCAQMFYNLLEVEVSSGVYYGTSLDCPISGGEVDFLALIETTLEGPFVYQSGTSGLSFSPKTVYYNGLLSTTAGLQSQDVYYYNEYLQSLWIYRETVTGTLTARSPSSTSPTSLTVGGEVYSIETSTASYQASSLQGVDLGDTVTLLLGLDDDVVAVQVQEHDGTMDYDLLSQDNLYGPYVWDGGDFEYSFTPVFVYDNNVLSDASVFAVDDVYYYNDLAKTVWIYTDSETGTISNLTTTSVTVNDNTYGFETTTASYKLSSLAGASVGDGVYLILGVDGVVDVEFYDNQSQLDYDLLSQSNLSGPYIWDGVTSKYSFSPLYVYDNQVLSSESALTVGDVYYFNESAKTVWIYSDSETGTITSLTSASVTVNSNTYAFETVAATYKLSALAGASTGDEVTLILGIDGVVDVEFHDNENQLDYDLFSQDNLSGPYIWDGGTAKYSFTPAYVYDNNVLSNIGAMSIGDVYYFNDSAKTVWIYTDNEMGTISSLTSTTVTVNSETYTFESTTASYKLSALAGAAVGDVVNLTLGITGVVDVEFYDSQDEIDYALLTQANLSDPYICNGTLPQLSFTPVAVYDNGELSSLSALSLNDVYYYNEVTKMVWIHSDTATGTLSARSSGISPTSVTVGGITYAVGSDEASYKLSALNGTSIGDTVTLLLGLDDSVVGIMDSSMTSAIYYGIVQSCEQEPSIYSGSTIQTVINIGCTDGNSYEFIIDDQVSYSDGAVVSVQLTNDGVSVSRLSSKSLSGTVNYSATKLGSYTFADNIQIIDVDDSGTIIDIDPERLANVTLKSDHVDYYVLNSAGEISHLILDEVTGDTFTYGYMTSASTSTGSMSITSQYTYFLNGVEQSLYLPTSSYNVKMGGIVMIYDDDGSLDSIQQLESSYLSQVTSTTAVYGNQEFDVAEDVQVYVYIDYAYQLVSLDDVSDTSLYTLTGWYDNQGFPAGGQIRVITARPK